jgi:prephenate dehydrogenase
VTAITAAQPLNKVAVIGLGLIGGSVAVALRQRGLAREVAGIAAGDDARQALELGLIDVAADSMASAVQGADLVVVATPVTAVRQVFADLATCADADTVITDCTSTKLSTVQAARELLGPMVASFVPGHPISGSEFSGPTAANPDQYVDKLWLLAPMPETRPDAVNLVRRMVESIGARCDQIDATEHDALFAEYSHAPHALVYAICDAVAAGPNAARLSELAGAGFKDTTRIGATAPGLWTDILLDNREPVLDSIDRYITAMTTLRKMLQAQDRDGLFALLQRAATWRSGLRDSNG